MAFAYPGASVLSMPTFPWPPRQTVRRVFPGTAFRRPSPCALSVTVVVEAQRSSELEQSQSHKQVVVGSPGAPRPITVLPPQEDSYPNLLSSDCFAARESVSCKARTLLRMFIAFRHSCLPLCTTHSVEARPHAPGKLCCLAPHHFPAPPTSLRSSRLSCRYQPT